MNNTIEISVVIPAKNMGKYLEKCLSSILVEQNIAIEVVVIDFGSTDTTIKIAEEYEKKDARVKLVFDENGDAASSRDKGIRHAIGKYIAFIDADDWIEENSLIALYEQIVSREADIISAQYKTIVEKDQALLSQSKYIEIFEHVKKENIDAILCRIGRGDYNLEIWNKLYRRQFIIDHNIHFNSKNGINGEDTLFNLQCILACPTIMTTPFVYYNHLIRENSLANSVGKKLSLRFMTIIEILVEDTRLKNYDCENGLSQVMISLQIQDFMDSLKITEGIKHAIKIYERFDFYQKYLSIAMVSNSSTISRKLLCFFMKKHAYKLIFIIYKKRSKIK